jgi:hypothetical protein
MRSRSTVLSWVRVAACAMIGRRFARPLYSERRIPPEVPGR